MDMKRMGPVILQEAKLISAGARCRFYRLNKQFSARNVQVSLDNVGMFAYPALLYDSAQPGQFFWPTVRTSGIR